MNNGLNEDEILQILKIVDESKLDELSLETGNLKLIIKKSAGTSSIQSMSKPMAQPAADCSKPAVVVKPCKMSAAAPKEDGLVAVKAPVLGIFYRAPSPGARPFVEEGSEVTENTIVCTIEVMKVFNSVPAGECGVVAQICVENGATVEYGQPLFYIRPAGESKE